MRAGSKTNQGGSCLYYREYIQLEPLRGTYRDPVGQGIAQKILLISRTPPPSSVETNTGVIHNQRQKPL